MGEVDQFDNRAAGHRHKMMWPGFQAVFGIPWPVKPFATCIIDGPELSKRIRIENRHEAIANAVDVYGQALRKYLREEEILQRSAEYVVGIHWG
jgi:hypothetical protein